MPTRKRETVPPVRMEPPPVPPSLPASGTGAHGPLARLAAGPLEYRARTSLVVPSVLYRLDPTMLEIHRVAPALGTTPPGPELLALAEVTRIRIRFVPTRVQRNRFECLVESRRGRCLTITNEEYLGFMDFADRSEEYTAFVRALCAAVALQNPTALFVGGRNAVVLFLEFAFCGGAFLMLGIVLWTLGGALRGLVILKLALIAFYLPTLARYAARAMPSHFNPLNVPEKYLPAGKKR